MGDNDGTEMFDLLAPFYLFNATEKANVYVVSEKKAPILLVNSLFILPHFSFSEIDSLGLTPDVIVIPNLTVHLKTPPKAANVNWIKKLYTGENTILAICDGAATAAATGIYDGKPITTHSSDWKQLKKQFPNVGWVQGVSYTRNKNLYSTAGVSNATEGSLAVIEELFGDQVMEKVKKDVRYPHRDIKKDHQNRVVNMAAVITIVKKILFKHDRDVVFLLQDGVNEFELATVLDTYSRTFPGSLNTFGGGIPIFKSKYGLTLLPTAQQLPDKPLDELHILRPDALSKTAENSLPHKELVTYDKDSLQYLFVVCMDRIQLLYGRNFAKTVKLMLDYDLN
ncbi:DJ-1/PfpI family protein [Adhaeribacter aquaticus]|uniref:DJ-1/PfpI family protein n=1 Tax=Adhaeribacter aquaticus TaxID=299567 RepID=UPI001B7FADE9|nr:DJ-1/PfpI family protein [Adhaeribacter aquaticus]